MTRYDLALWALDVLEPEDAARVAERVAASAALQRRVASIRAELAGVRGALEPSGWRIRRGFSRGLHVGAEASVFAHGPLRTGDRVALTLSATAPTEGAIVVLLHRPPGETWRLDVPRVVEDLLRLADLPAGPDGSRVLDVLVPAGRGSHELAVLAVPPGALRWALPPDQRLAALQAFVAENDVPLTTTTLEVGVK